MGTTENHAKTLANLVAADENADVQTLEACFAGQRCEHWLSQLDAADIAAHRVLSINDVIAQYTRKANNEAADETVNGAIDVLHWDDHPIGSPVTLLAPTWVRVGEVQSYRRLSPTPKSGEHSLEILRQLGYQEKEIEDLVRFKVVQGKGQC